MYSLDSPEFSFEQEGGGPCHFSRPRERSTSHPCLEAESTGLSCLQKMWIWKRQMRPQNRAYRHNAPKLRPSHPYMASTHGLPTSPGRFAFWLLMQKNRMGGGAQCQPAAMSSQRELPAECSHLAKEFPFRAREPAVSEIPLPMRAAELMSDCLLLER